MKTPVEMGHWVLGGKPGSENDKMLTLLNFDSEPEFGILHCSLLTFSVDYRYHTAHTLLDNKLKLTLLALASRLTLITQQWVAQ